MQAREFSGHFEELSGLFSVSYAETEAAPRKHYHIHDAYEVTLVLSDSVELDVNDESYPVPAGSLLLFNTMDLHRIRYTGNGTYRRFVIWFKQDFLHGLDPMVYRLLRCFYARGFERACLLPLSQKDLERVRHTYERLQSIAAEPLYMQNELLALVMGELLIEINRLYLAVNGPHTGDERTDRATVYRAILHVQEHFAQKISRSTLSRMLGSEERRLSDGFKSLTGLTTGQYILHVRLTAAKAFLIQGMPVTEVCEKTGFENWSNFSRTFRNHVGMSPKQYAMQHRKTLL